MRNETFLIFSCILKTWTEINALTITDFSLLRLIEHFKIGISQVAAYEDDIFDQNSKPSTPPHPTLSISPSPQNSYTIIFSHSAQQSSPGTTFVWTRIGIWVCHTMPKNYLKYLPTFKFISVS